MSDLNLLTDDELHRIRGATIICIGYYRGFGYLNPAFYLFTEDTGWERPLIVDATTFPKYEVRQP